MRSRAIAALTCLALLVIVPAPPAGAADPPKRKPLTQDERAAVLTLIKAVDLAQETGVVAPDAGWDNHVLKSTNQTAYVPFRLTIGAEMGRSGLVYVRAVSRREGVRARDERSQVRDSLARPGSQMARMPETVYVGPGEMPVGGPAAGSSRRSTAAPAEASAMLALQQRDAERQKAAADTARKKAEVKERDPFLFPFEDYYVADFGPPRGSDSRRLERALSLPPGEYDVYVATIDRAKLKTSGAAVANHVVTIPDFWNDRLVLSTLILASDVKTLPAALTPLQQAEHPFTFGRAEVLPVRAPMFATDDVLSIVYQICNYGAPDADLAADYSFYRIDGGTRQLFNRTPPQTFADDDLPPPNPWETQAFATQSVSLQTFPPGAYELEVTVRDRLTRATASRSVSFTVAPR